MLSIEYFRDFDIIYFLMINNSKKEHFCAMCGETLCKRKVKIIGYPKHDPKVGTGYKSAFLCANNECWGKVSEVALGLCSKRGHHDYNRIDRVVKEAVSKFSITCLMCDNSFKATTDHVYVEWNCGIDICIRCPKCDEIYSIEGENVCKERYKV